MRAFLAACVAVVIIGAGGYLVLTEIQQPTGVAYTTGGARISPQWSWRSVFRADASGPATKTAMNMPDAPNALTEECDLRSTWHWIFVDFGSPDGESSICSVSQ
jgi:hypothetical protein